MIAICNLVRIFILDGGVEFGELFEKWHSRIGLRVKSKYSEKISNV